MWCSLYQYVSQLHAEQKRIDHTIQRLEVQLANTPHPHSNRGRKTEYDVGGRENAGFTTYEIVLGSAAF